MADTLSRRFAPIGACLVAAFGAAVVALAGMKPDLAPATMVQEAPPARPKGLALLGRQVDDAVLTSAQGDAVVWGALKGAPRAVFFGFTHCPEICPTTLNDLSGAITRLGETAAPLRVDFVSVDPARDTTALLKGYVGHFGPQFRGYTGSEEEIARLARAYRAAYRRVPIEGGDYTMDHTTSVYLVDARGEVRDIIAYQSPPERLDAQLREFLNP